MDDPTTTPNTTLLTTVGAERPASGNTAQRHRRGRRGNNEGSIFQRQDGRWAGVVTVSLGQRRWLYGATKEAVRRRVTAALKATQDGIPIPGESETVGRFLTHWLEETVRNKVGPATYVSYAAIVRLHIAPELGTVRLTRLTPSHVQALLNKKLAAGLSPRRVEYIRAVLRQALGHALRWDLVTRNVATLTDRPHPNRREIRPLDAEQAQRFLEAVRGDRLEALYAVALTLGVRQGEALGLHWEDVDFDSRVVHIRRSLARINGEFVLINPKTTRSVRRLGPLPDTLMEMLRAHKQRQTEERLAAPAWPESGFVFTTSAGSPLHSSTVTKAFQRHLAAAGLPPQRFHDLRHACASLLMTQGVNPRVVMSILGHSQITLTLDTYSHVAQSTQRDALAGLSASLSG